MAKTDSSQEPDVSDIIATLDRIEGAYALKIQEYRALINLKTGNSEAPPEATCHADVIRIPDVVYRPRRAA
ncbi:MAG: hypothetical protein GY903_28845 [Fuerstiella sp.]|nr:hypothetical protein [Fuerstiella sp.]MCP4858503.1 hypothetical protein [Fuerstiella sp.]